MRLRGTTSCYEAARLAERRPETWALLGGGRGVVGQSELASREHKATDSNEERQEGVGSESDDPVVNGKRIVVPVDGGSPAISQAGAIHDLATLNDIVETLNRAVDVFSALDTALARLVELMGLESGLVYVNSQDSPEGGDEATYTLAAHHNLPPEGRAGWPFTHRLRCGHANGRWAY